MTSKLTAAFIFGLPLAVILVFWLMAMRERRVAGDPGARGFMRRNGAAIGTYLVVGVGFWALFLIVFPQLYMVDYSFHPKLPPAQRGGENDVYTLQNYRYFLFGSTTSTESWNVTHLNAFWQTIFVSVLVTIFNFALCYPIAYAMA